MTNFSKTERQLFKFDEKLGVAFGFAIVSKVDGERYFDVQGDHIPESSMIRASCDFMQHSRVGKTMHTGDKTGDIVFAFPLTSDIAKSLGITTSKTGLLVGFRPSDPETIEQMERGEFSGFSIGGERVDDQEVDE